MSYNKRTYTNSTDERVTYEDFNRIEGGISDNDAEITRQKDPTQNGTLAKKISDINTDLGSTALTTTSQNVHEAINEHETDISNLEEKFAESTIELLNGWIVEFGNTAISKVNNTVTFNLNIKSGVTAVGTNICRLPEGFRPSNGLLIDYLCYNVSWVASVGTVWIGTDGYVTIAEGNVVYNNRLVVNADFVIKRESGE